MTEEEFDSPFTFFQNLSCLLKIQVQKRDNFKIIEYVRLAPMPLANHSHIGEYVSIMTLSHGIALGWLSPIAAHLASDKTPLEEKLNVYQASWVGSLIAIGAFFSNIFTGIPLYYCGRKPVMYFLAFPHAIHWILIYFATSVTYLYVARFLAGMTGGSILIVFPIFVSEIADTNIRGALTSTIICATSTGVLLGFTLGHFLDYSVLPCIMLLLPLIYLASITFLPETPLFLIRADAETKKQFKEFEEGHSIVVEQVSVSDYCNKEAWKAYGLIYVLLFTHQMSGNFAIITYATTIFKHLNNDFHVNLSAIGLGVSQLLGMMIAIVLVDRVGRRILLLSSMAGMAAGELTIVCLKYFASMQFLKEHGWFGLVTMCLISLIAGIGVGSLTFLVVVELLPHKIISIGCSMCMVQLSIFAFMTLKIYPVMIEEHGLGPTMLMSASVLLVALTILGIFLPETKNKKLA
ncbi:facilitated trehalose transporter Tret1 isoform X2 [Drosophila ananassae]|uniref:facilitated trehalose transporter Tret1 isoform X2 n=1 Tax=Drosophila ananassae TaxID=7217 RepID=UPI001CFF747F|nr:facilitated trehalose transporter Tret1 isoform X2 [Drosophila ananassae]